MPYYKNKTKSNLVKSQQYIEEIMFSDLNKIESISETPDADSYELHLFIRASNWDAWTVIDQVAKDVSKSLPEETLTWLLIDESS